MAKTAGPRVYGPFVRSIRWVARLIQPRYTCDAVPQGEPVVYVCRHLKMRGTYALVKWLGQEAHPMSLAIFFNRQTAYKHFREYTFSARQGKSPKKRSLAAWVTALVTVWLEKSMKAIPVHRDSQAIKTMREALKWLQQGESVMVWPDVDYAAEYDKAPCKIYTGFLSLGEMYLKRTGKELKFVPLYIDDQNRNIVVREPVVVNRFKEEAEEAALVLAKRIDP
ncbi:MAG: hypothetical protein IJ461_00805 [Clostridia bacterium]|nr:hypothetical protein [Clostridia bacterium]